MEYNTRVDVPVHLKADKRLWHSWLEPKSLCFVNTLCQQQQHQLTFHAQTPLSINSSFRICALCFFLLRCVGILDDERITLFEQAFAKRYQVDGESSIKIETIQIKSKCEQLHRLSNNNSFSFALCALEFISTQPGLQSVVCAELYNVSDCVAGWLNFDLMIAKRKRYYLLRSVKTAHFPCRNSLSRRILTYTLRVVLLVSALAYE